MLVRLKDVPLNEPLAMTVMPPALAGAAQVGTPPATVKMLPELPMPKRVLVFAVADE